MLTVPVMARKMYFLMAICLILVHEVFSDLGVGDVCPLRKENPEGQICQKACAMHLDCPKKKQRCLCDGECGMSCVISRSICPWPVSIENAETSLKQETRSFGDQMLVRCLMGFTMANGQEVAESRCQGDKKWSVTAPCDVISTCEDPPSIDNGYFIKNGYLLNGTSAQYKCNPGYKLEGHEVTECLEDNVWSNPTPTCNKIYCSPPPEINEGILIAVKKAEYEISEVIYYMCKRNFYTDGSNSVTCMDNGQWSKCPVCRARCKVPVYRSRVVYKGQKVWVTEIDEGLVHHSENVTFFCQKKAESCSYTASTQCFDGDLPLPECYAEPTWVQYNLFPKRLVSEISMCEEL
ncbi:beta-2-glycoprotein 1-like [Pseudophryne corroboree]|uniref:beta-2-glycoprotein 1-like n=1 Tax=Pseudophryne corroboree TaxID=495146 RepID=UPI003081AE6B